MSRARRPAKLPGVSSSSSASIAPVGRRHLLPPLPSARPSLRVRLVARLRSQRLDREIAGGADVVRSRTLAARAETLISRETRLEVAAGLEGVLALADGAVPRRMGGAPVRTDEVRAAAEPLRELVDTLRARRPITPRGMAIARRLLHDGRTPVYARAPRGALALAALDALACVGPAR
jgi:hypothetical protein